MSLNDLAVGAQERIEYAADKLVGGLPRGVADEVARLELMIDALRKEVARLRRDVFPLEDR